MATRPFDQSVSSIMNNRRELNQSRPLTPIFRATDYLTPSMRSRVNDLQTGHMTKIGPEKAEKSAPTQ